MEIITSFFWGSQKVWEKKQQKDVFCFTFPATQYLHNVKYAQLHDLAGEPSTFEVVK